MAYQDYGTTFPKPPVNNQMPTSTGPVGGQYSGGQPSGQPVGVPIGQQPPSAGFPAMTQDWLKNHPATAANMANPMWQKNFAAYQKNFGGNPPRPMPVPPKPTPVPPGGQFTLPNLNRFGGPGTGGNGFVPPGLQQFNGAPPGQFQQPPQGVPIGQQYGGGNRPPGQYKPTAQYNRYGRQRRDWATRGLGQ